MLDVQKVRLRFISARLLASAPPICKSAGKAAHLLRCIMKSVRPCTLFMANFGKAEISLLFKPAASVPLLKILNVSERTRMSVDWAVASFSREKLVVDQCTRRYTSQQAICKRLTEKAGLLRREGFTVWILISMLYGNAIGKICRLIWGACYGAFVIINC